MTAHRRIRVLLLDDHALLAQAAAVALQADGFETRHAALSSRDALATSVESDPPDVVVLDLDSGGPDRDAAALVRSLVRAGARVLVVSADDDGPRVGTALEDGAVGHLPRSVPLQELVTAVSAAVRGDDVMPPGRRQAALAGLRASRESEAAARRPFDRLTVREQQVLRELGNGKVVATIAEEWLVSEATVRSQVRGVLAKLGVSSQLEAVALATRSGWLSDRAGTDPAGARTRPRPLDGTGVSTDERV
jgi:DNA-binding NarL/FixJ family response regulator